MRTLTLLPIAILAAACGASAPAVAPDGTVDVPNDETGLRAKIPDNAVPNSSFGGMAGFHSEDKSISVMIKEAAADATFDSAKSDAEGLLFKSWISSEETSDGWVLQYESTGMDMEGNEYTQYAYEVVRDVGGTKYECSGSVKDKAHIDANLTICNSLKKG